VSKNAQYVHKALQEELKQQGAVGFNQINFPFGAEVFAIEHDINDTVLARVGSMYVDSMYAIEKQPIKRFKLRYNVEGRACFDSKDYGRFFMDETQRVIQ
jgi:hypothetical protein